MNLTNKRASRNRRRESYDIEQRSSLLPVVVAATAAAVLMHVLIYFSLPYLVRWNIIEIPERVDPIEEIIRIVASEREVEEHKPEEDIPEQEAPDEIIINHEEVEIDLMDMEFEELVMAPGETNLAVMEPDVQDQAPTPEVMPFGDATLDLPVTPLPETEENSLEPAPINNNDVVANLPAADLGDVESSIKAELQANAGQEDGLPEDNRSLEQLMRIRNPGASSGVARLGSDVLFVFGKADLLNASRVTMIQLAALISKNPNTRFVIEGHTDSFGSLDFNDVLSLQRAASVRNWLKGNGIPVENVYLRARGSRSHLVPAAGTAEEQTLNRRVEIHMRKPDEKLPAGCYDSKVNIDVQKSTSAYVREGLLKRLEPLKTK